MCIEKYWLACLLTDFLEGLFERGVFVAIALKIFPPTSFDSLLKIA
jgi:hypothetical protein